MQRHFIDHTLTKRIEMADAASSRRCGQVLAKHYPDTGACTEDVAGGCAIFAGVGSPITQAIGLGMDVEVSEADITRMEKFFESRGARVEVECCPFAHPTLREQFDRRGYRVLEWTNVLCRHIEPQTTSPQLPPGVEIRQANADQADLWASLLCQGFAADLGEAALTLMGVGSALFKAASAGFLAYVDGHPAGGATVFVHEDEGGAVAGMMGASTLPAYRRRGVQIALLNARLDFARARGCDLAYTITAPGSGSQRNAERTGFQMAYTRSKMYKT
jgi:GNAT superfamily N-acetyltransferase